MDKLLHSQEYKSFLEEVKTTIRQTQTRVARAANRELIQLYWSIGKHIVERQQQLGWGKTVVEQLAQDLRNTFPGRSGFSARNQRMSSSPCSIAFAMNW